MDTVVAQRVVQDLVDLNAALLLQGMRVLSSIDDETYTRPAALFEGQRIGGHIRHIVDFYECLLKGVPSGVIDYAARRRDPMVESDRTVAMARLSEIRGRLQSESETFEDLDLTLQPEESPAGNLRSTAGRELEALASHTVHHFALVAVLLRYFGFAVSPDFGVSQATLRYRAGV